MKLNSLQSPFASTSIFLVGAFSILASAQTYTLTVGLSDSIRPATHCASGSLYGMTETLPSDITNLVAPLKPYSFTQPAISGNGHQQPIGDALKVSERLLGTTGKVQIRLADILPGWPYNWPGQAAWLASVKSIIQNKIASGRTNYDGYEIWNEPDGTWKTANGDFNTTVWKPTYDLIRSLDPSAKIIGPSLSYYSESNMSSLLTYCKNNNCLPDIISWHQWGSEGFVGAYENLRALETRLGISPRKLSINEYSSNTHVYEGSPGVSVPFIAKFERYNVESAMISWWFTGLPGRLGSLLTAKNAKGGGWWMYKWYGDMSGYMTKVTPPKDKSDGVDAFAAVDKNAKYASIVLGGNNTGTVNVNIGGIPAWFGSSVNAKLEYVTWVNKDSAVASTIQISNSQMNVNNGSISIPVNVTSQFNAYRIYLTPVATSSSSTPSSSSSAVPQAAYSSATIPGIVQVENYDVGGMNVAYFDTEDQNIGTASGYRTGGVDLDSMGGAIFQSYSLADEWMEYSLYVSKDGPMDITCRVASGGESGKFLLWMDGVRIADTIAVPNTGGWTTFMNISGQTSSLTKGQHTLKISVVGSYFNFDWIQFSEVGTTKVIQQIRNPLSREMRSNGMVDLLGRKLKR